MPNFSAEYSSSTASTPIVPKTRNYRNNETPELASTTPLAPPPSRPFGSSQAGTGVSKLRFVENSRQLPTHKQPNSFGLSTTTQGTYEDDGDYTQDMDEDEMEEDEEGIDFNPQYTRPMRTQYNLAPPQAPSLMKFSTNETTQDRNRAPFQASTRAAQYSMLPSRGSQDFAPRLARELKTGLAPALLRNDPEDVVIRAERILRNIQEEAQSADDDTLDALLVEASGDLEQVWEESPMSRHQRLEGDAYIGPGPSATPFENAHYVAVLILRLLTAPKSGVDDAGPIAVPQILLDWLNDFHMNLEAPYNQVRTASPNSTSDEYFWDVIEGLISRGKLEEVINLFGDAEFAHAKMDRGSGLMDANYNGTELQLIRTAVDATKALLERCPAVTDGDWFVNGPNWTAFRRDVESATEELRDFVHMHEDSQLMEAEIEAGTIRPEKSLPFEIFQRLSTLHNILLGSTEEIIYLSNDWLEAAVLLTVWWNGETGNKVQQWSFDVSRAYQPDADMTLGFRAYLNRLKESFLAVTDPNSPKFPLNPSSPVELAVALTLQGQMSFVLLLLQTYSLNITSTLAEIGSWAGWLDSTSVPEGLEKEDMEVLSEGLAVITKDEILECYAKALFEQEELELNRNTIVGGWEIAISVASRCDNRALAGELIDQFLQELPITTTERASRLVKLCGELEMWEQSRHVSKEYGDYLVKTSEEFGTALLCYAQSHSEYNVRQVIDLLSSYCLVQSRAYPAETELDNALSQLVSNPKSALASIAEADPEAVEVLQFYLVGYACLRKYYTARDNAKTGPNKKLAAKALVAAINSAADCIYGGLYDAERQTAIQVDGLLPLLGEATALTAANNGGTRIFTTDQLYAILAAIEDLQTVSDRVYAATEECLIATLRQYNGSQPPSPHATLKKSMSSGTNSNFSFSMMGSEMLANSSESFGARSMGSAVLVSNRKAPSTDGDGIERGWDWRSNFSGQDITGVDVLKSLRLCIAEELSVASLEHA